MPISRERPPRLKAAFDLAVCSYTSSGVRIKCDVGGVNACGILPHERRAPARNLGGTVEWQLHPILGTVGLILFSGGIIR